METLVAQPKVEFNLHQRTRNDAETWFAEVLDGSMRTPFEYQTDGHEIYAEDGSALQPIFEDAIVEAGRLRQKNPQLGFELRRRQLERSEYDEMLAMVRGDLPNAMVVVSDFPAELRAATEDVGGYNVARKQTMLRVITFADGRLRMYSQSLDGSNRQALEAIYLAFGIAPQPGELLGQRIHFQCGKEDQAYLVDRLTAIYDHSLSGQLGGEWYAGRREPKRDTYSFVRGQQELVDRFVAQQIDGRMTENERYNIAALLAKRFEEAKTVPGYDGDSSGFECYIGSVMTHSLEWELQQAGDEARASGKTFSGCGASVSAITASEQLSEAGYGNQSESGNDEDKFGPLTFKCKNGHTNRRPRGKLIDKCWVPNCKDSVGC